MPKVKKDKKASKIFLSKWFRLVTAILSIGFIVQTIMGVVNLPLIRGNTATFFTNDIISVWRYVDEFGEEPGEDDKNSELGLLALDKRKLLRFNGQSEERFNVLKLNYFSQQRNLPYAFMQGEYYLSENDNTDYLIKYEHRYVGNYTFRAHAYLYNQSDPSKMISRITCDVYKKDTSNYAYYYKTVSDINKDGEKTFLNPKDQLYLKYTSIFNARYQWFDEDLSTLFQKKVVPYLDLTYEDYSTQMNDGVSAFVSYRFTMQSLILWGVILGLTSILLCILSFIKKGKVKKKESVMFDDIDQMDYSDVKVSAKLTRVPKNSGFNLRVHEFEIKVVALIFLFLSSMVTFVVFLDAVKVNVPMLPGNDHVRDIFANLSIIAVILLYFLKLDIYQNKKNAAAYSWFLFITGLLYYFLILIVYAVFDGMGSSATSILDTILAYFPGNIIWAVLTFNVFTIFLFSKPKFKNDTKVKHTLFRLCSLIPFSYLIISSIVSLGMKMGGWNVHYAISSLLFFKAPYITIFALFYSLIVFFYRRYTVKKYGETNAILYQSGNKYNLVRNISACAIILVIGVVDLIFLFAYPGNKLGFGTNYLVLLAIPLILFYHPHIGKRNGTWDVCYNILYVYVYIAGILAIVGVVLSFLTTF